MFVKIFAQILDSSIADDYQIRHVFEDFLKLADKEGVVDMTPAAIARRTGVPVEIVTRAIDKLSQPDPESRSTDEDGRRIVPLDAHRSWGWRIVNYLHYRNIRDEEDRRSYFRERKRIQRARESSTAETASRPGQPEMSKTVKDSPAVSTQAEAEAEAKTKSATETPSGLSSGDLEGAKTKKAHRDHGNDEIERVYQAYPLKKGSEAAKKSIGKALDRLRIRGESDPASFLVGRIAGWKASRERDNAAGKFVPDYPYPQKWFNEERYDDDLSLADAKPRPVIPDKPVFEQRSTLIPMAEMRARAGIQ